MSELRLPPELGAEMADIYKELQAEYERVANAIGLSCMGCPDNCCDSYFFHHTYAEWAFLWQGLAALEVSRLETVRERARQYQEAAQAAEAAGERPQGMCPLNEAGLCLVYQHRLLICRSHGVPARLAGPGGMRHFPGCFRCQEIVARRFRTPAEAPFVDRSPLFRRLALLEARFLGANRVRYPKLRLTIADMILQGPPQSR